MQRAALMFALVMILGLCLGLALWRAFRDHPTNKDGLSEETGESALRDDSTNHIEEPGENDTIAEMDSYKNSRAKRSECEEGVNWIDIDETAYDIDPRSSIIRNNVWEVRRDIILLHVDNLVTMPQCIVKMYVTINGIEVDFQSPIGSEVTLDNSGWGSCSPINATVTVLDELNQEKTLEQIIEPKENCEKEMLTTISRAPEEGEPSKVKSKSSVTSPVVGGLALCVVVVVVIVGLARTSIGGVTRRGAVSTGEDHGEDIELPELRSKDRNTEARSSLTRGKRKSQMKERVMERMKNEPLNVEGCTYSFVEDYGTCYAGDVNKSIERSDQEGSSVRRSKFITTIRDNP